MNDQELHNVARIHHHDFGPNYTLRAPQATLIEDCTGGTLTIEGRLLNGTRFKNCKFEALLFSNTHCDNVYLESIHINFLTFVTEPEHSIAAGNIHLANIKGDTKIAFEAKVVSKLVLTACNELRTIEAVANESGPSTFLSVTFESVALSTLRFEATSVTEQFLLNQSNIDHLILLDSNLPSGFKISNRSSVTYLEVERCAVRAIDCESESKFQSLFFNESKLTILAVKSGPIASLKFVKTAISLCEIGGATNDTRIDVSNFTSTYSSSNGKMLFQNLNLQIFELSNIELTSEFVLANVTIGNKFIIEDVTIAAPSKVEFRSLDLQRTDSIVLYNTYLIGAKFHLVHWHNDYRLDLLQQKLKSKTKEGQLNHLLVIKESYRQLKVISTQNSNKIDATFFQTGELDTYRHFLKLKLDRQFTIGNLLDYVILLFSKYLGGYGLYIASPITWWIIIHLALMLFVVHPHFNLQIAPSLVCIDTSSTFKSVKVFVLLMNPIRSNELYHVKLEPFLDFVIRFYSTFFLYYIIRASRKFIFSP